MPNSYLHYNHSAMDELFPHTVHGFLLDMDGTFYLGNQLLPGAFDFLLKLKLKKIPFLFLTNNSSKNRIEYRDKLFDLGISVAEDQIVTSGQVAVAELARKYDKGRVALLGNQSLTDEFLIAGFSSTYDDPDIAVLGYNDNLTYDNLTKFCSVLFNKNIPYYATHADLVYPSPIGFLPDAGSFIESVSAVTGRRPDMVFGKPNYPILNMASSILKVPIVNLAMIGDRLYTDIALKQHGLFTILTMSGETKQSDLAASPWKPDLIINNLHDLT